MADFKFSIRSLFDNRGTRAAGRGLAALKVNLQKTGEQLAKVGRGFQTAFGGAARLLRRTATGLLGMGAALTAAAVQAAKFNTNVARATTMMGGDFLKNFAEARKEVLNLSSALGLAKDELAGGLYQALSAGVPQNNVFTFLEQAAKVAIADGSDVATAIDGVTTVLNAFKIEATDAGDVIDKMFQTVASGKTTFGQLSSSLSTVASQASSAGISFEEVLAAVATLTKSGTPTAQAMTQLRAAIIGLNKVMGDGWAEKGSLQDALVYLERQTGGSQNEMLKLLGSTEALAAALGLTGQNAQTAAADLTNMQNAAGKATEAFENVQQFRHWEVGFARIKAAATDFGNQIDQAIGPAFLRISEQLEKWRSSDNPFGGLKTGIQEAVATIEGVLSSLQEAPQKTYEAIGDLLSAALSYGGELAAKAIAKAAPVIGDLIGTAARKAMVSLGTSAGREYKARRQLQREGEISWLGQSPVFNSDEDERKIRERVEANKQTELEQTGAAAAAKLAANASAQFNEALKALQDLAAAHNENSAAMLAELKRQKEKTNQVSQQVADLKN